MTTRTAPSPAEILEALSERAPHGLGGLVDWDQAATSVRLLFRTTPARAHQWLAAALSEGVLRHVYVSEHGMVSVVYTDADGKQWRGTPSQSGFGTRGTDNYFKAEGVRPGAYVATAEVLTEMAQKARQAAADADARYRTRKASDAAALRARHGDSIEVLRALLKGASGDPRDRENGAYLVAHAGDPDDPILGHDSVTITLSGSSIDAVAAMLRERGITP